MTTVYELSNIFRPYSDMYLFHILDAYIMGRAASTQFVSVGAALFLLALFFQPENRSGPRFQARLLFLGIVAVVIVLLGGFKWMIAGGNDEKTNEAKKLIVSGIIGLAIILSAWAITSFVISRLVSATQEV